MMISMNFLINILHDDFNYDINDDSEGKDDINDDSNDNFSKNGSTVEDDFELKRSSKFNEDFDLGTDQFYCNICDVFCSEKETFVKHMYLFHK